MAKLYVVATPIGNLKDITLRALETLATVPLVAAEDTRVAQKLFTAHGLSAQFISYHQHNTGARDEQILNHLQDEKDVALLTDAGTPLISDPGSSLVAKCRAANIEVVPIPGVSALITAMSVCDLETNRFCFEGFLPPKKSARCKRLANFKLETRAIVCFEAKHRITDLVVDIVEILGADRKIMLARELTKIYEQLITDDAHNILTMLREGALETKGEFVVVIAGGTERAEHEQDLEKVEVLFASLKNSISHKDAVKLAQSLFSLPKNQLYELAQRYFQD